MDDEFVTIREYRAPWEAHVAAARLEDEGIPCEIDDEDAATVFGSAVDFVKLKVPESLSERADEILQELDEAAQHDDGEGEEDDEQ